MFEEYQSWLSVVHLGDLVGDVRGVSLPLLDCCFTGLTPALLNCAQLMGIAPMQYNFQGAFFTEIMVSFPLGRNM
jgi:hypothetical protein